MIYDLIARRTQSPDLAVTRDAKPACPLPDTPQVAVIQISAPSRSSSGSPSIGQLG